MPRTKSTLTARCLIWALAAAILCAGVIAAEKARTEYETKAACIYQLAVFTKWPAEKLAGDAPFVIGILGEDPFRSDIDKTVAGESIDRHPVEVRRLKSDEEAKKVHILFISKSERRRIHQILGALRGASVLTVGEWDTFCEDGGIVQFLTEPVAGDRVKVKLGTLNLKILQSEKLQMDPSVKDLFVHRYPARNQ